MFKKVALIDADSLSFICSKENLNESIHNLEIFISEILLGVKADEYVLILSKKPYFRTNVSNDYKFRREQRDTGLLWTVELRNYMIEKHKAIFMEGVEADDLVAYYSLKIKEANNGIIPIICSGDKDVLRQIAGTHYDYRKHEWHTTSELDAYKFLYFQCLSGDSTDCITGIPGVGPKNAEKILSKALKADDFLLLSLNAFTNYYAEEAEGVFNFQKTYRLVYLLRTEKDFMREVGQIPETIKPLPITILGDD